jgi:hypothetical protein
VNCARYGSIGFATSLAFYLSQPKRSALAKEVLADSDEAQFIEVVVVL